MVQAPALYRELRIRMIVVLQKAALIGGGLFLLAGFVDLIETPIFPWDGISVMGTALFSIWLLRRDNVHQSGNWLLVGMLWAVMFNMPFYGVNHPNTALVLVCIVVSGLLVGGYFQWMMILLCGLFIPFWVYAEIAGESDAMVAVQSTPEGVYTAVFWLTTFAMTGWLVWLFARQLERAVTDSQGKTMALAQTGKLLQNEVDLRTFAAEVVKTAAQQLAADAAWLFWTQEQPIAYSSSERPTASLEYELTPDTPIWQTLAAENGVIAIDKAASDGRLPARERLAAAGVQSVLLAPVRHQQEMIGVLMLGSHKRRRFAVDELALAEAIVQQLSLALLLDEYAVTAQETAVVQERNRMAREMHDVLAQGFTGVIVQLEAAADVLETDRQAVNAHIGRAQALARHSLQEARRSVRGLRPQPLEEAALPQALRRLVAQMTGGAAVEGSFVCQGAERPLPAQVENNLLRIAQEGVTNILKYASARQMQMRLQFEPHGVTLQISDDGVGFDVHQPHTGLGLLGMHERAQTIGAQLTIDSELGDGTIITVRWEDG